MKKIFSLFVIALLVLPGVFAQATVADITAPLTKIYDLLKAVISVVAGIAICIAATQFMFSGGNIQAREAAKSMIGYCIVGLVLVWVAPLMVSFLTGPAP